MTSSVGSGSVGSGYTSITSSNQSISGLVSGMDTTTIVSQLMQIEAQPQQALQGQLTKVQTDAAAYRDVNTSFAALATAAAAVTQASSWQAASASSSDSSISASTTGPAVPGSLTFTVDRLATAHSVMANSNWTNLTDPANLGSTLTIKSTDGTKTFGTIDLTSSTTGPASLNDAIAAINKSPLGLTASAIQTTNGYALQITSATTGQAKAFQIQSDTDPTGANYTVATQGVDAQIEFSNPTTPGTPYYSTSSTNTFNNVLSGTSFTVSKTGVTATVSVAKSPDAVATAVQNMVDAANAALAKISQYSDSSSGSTAPLKGDWGLISLSGQILDAVSTAVKTAGAPTGASSAGLNGLQLTPTGTLTFDATAFKAALAANPSLVQSVFGGSVGNGTDNVPNTVDDTVDLDGVAARLQTLASRASDAVSGSLTLLANGEDSTATDIESQIDDWTTRLQLRQQTLTDQFNAMETALGTLKSQSSWLTSQINSLPGMSTTKSS